MCVITRVVSVGEADVTTEADLDADGYPEIYFCGDMASDDYVLNVWSMKTGTPELIPFEDQIYLEAAIIGVSDNSLQLESTQNVLGSYSAIRAYALHDVPDAGLWEFRGRTAVHTYTAAMCWAACAAG